MRKYLKNILLKTRIYLSIISVDHYKNISEFLDKIRPIKSSTPLIRIGSENDGGYLVPDDFKNIKHCFSPGISDNISFESTLSKIYNIDCFLCDYSIAAPPFKVNRHFFIKKFLGNESNSKTITLENWIEQNVSNPQNMILQMDIEGCEYDVLMDVKESTLEQFRIIVIEFHHFSQILSPLGFKLINFVFDKILKSHSIVHIHPNNVGNNTIYKDVEIPEILEFTFLKNDRIETRNYNTDFPHELDRDNSLNHKTKVLPKCFYER